MLRCWNAGGPGFKSPRPHHSDNNNSVLEYGYLLQSLKREKYH
ncbi:protein of unknown function [Candidatus Nitrosocaldus cavascurensis]|uniref:Uncharacterized protein n=1 Tax=Candidatus Nitrosocaldus cavascurensis TaxID=2058097 RepID=A0A2K5ATD9_9ARCH|nr:protein of unknown function [Candidatus Nitrosocaldus cavascurensis]